MAAADEAAPHIALFPCSGMGHLIPFLRLASMLESRRCTVTVIAVHPTVSSSESDQLSTFFSAHPSIKRLEFRLLPQNKEESSNLKNDDPFFKQMEAINSSVHLLQPLLSSSSPPLSAIFADFPITLTAADLALKLSVDAYVVVTTSARFLSLMACLPQLLAANGVATEGGCIEIPGLGTTPISSIPPIMLDSDTFFAANIRSSVSSLFRAKGVLINTFNWFESDAIETLRSSEEAVGPIFPIGPFESFETKPGTIHPWLDKQEAESVLFVSFGSRTALSMDQIRELGLGLELSGCKFLWVLKTSKVDREDKAGIEDILGEPFLARTKEQGTVVKGWVNQEQILAHPCIGGFISHCGWNSVVEAAMFGVPILAWPQHGDQRVNSEVVQKAGLGLWVKEWGWSGEEKKLVLKEEIAQTIKELMFGENLRQRAKEVSNEARRARERNGTSESSLRSLIASLKRS